MEIEERIKKRKKLNRMVSCKDVRDQIDAESLACVKPYSDGDGDGAFRVIKWVTYHGTVIHCDFFEKYGYKFYVYKKRFYVVKDKEVIFRNSNGCGINEKGFAEILYTHNKQLLCIFLHSLFSRLCILNRAVHDADVAYEAAYDAAAAAADAAADVRATAAADVARAAGIYSAADVAYDAATAAAAAAATYPAAADAARAVAIVAATYTTVRQAFRKMIKLRKILLNEKRLCP